MGKEEERTVGKSRNKKRVAKKLEESRKSRDSREHLREYGKKGGGGKKINESRYNCNYNSN